VSTTASIVINNFNYARFVGDAIESALAQTYPDVEVIVVDDGSTDGSRKEIRRYRSKVTAVLKKNGGQASCFNAGFERSSGDVVLFLDADDMLLPTAVERVLECFDAASPAKVHWPLWEIEADGTRTPTLRPEALLPRGDLLERTLRLGPRSHTTPPTSGNAWAREALAEMLPMPEREYVICADAYLVALTPLFGEVERVLEPQSLWRRHGDNKFNSATRTIEQRLADEIARYEHIAATLAARLADSDAAPDPEVWKKRNGGYKRLERMHSAIREIKRLVPPGSAYVLADDGDWTANSNWAGSEILADRRRIAFLPPSVGDAAGASARGAIQRLGELREEGATHVFFAWPATWWLEHHVELSEYLRATARPVLERGNLVAFDLEPARADGTAPAPARHERAAEVQRLRRRRQELAQQQRALAADIAVLRNAVAQARTLEPARVPERDRLARSHGDSD
jgi:glycosyltransferase involved in cell wall biosynthesis